MTTAVLIAGLATAGVLIATGIADAFGADVYGWAKRIVAGTKRRELASSAIAAVKESPTGIQAPVTQTTSSSGPDAQSQEEHKCYTALIAALAQIEGNTPALVTAVHTPTAQPTAGDLIRIVWRAQEDCGRWLSHYVHVCDPAVVTAIQNVMVGTIDLCSLAAAHEQLGPANPRAIFETHRELQNKVHAARQAVARRERRMRGLT